MADCIAGCFSGATANPNLNPICGLTLTAFCKSFPPFHLNPRHPRHLTHSLGRAHLSRTDGTSNVTATVVDRCGGCAFYDLDLSRGAFDLLASEDLGRIDITWEWN